MVNLRAAFLILAKDLRLRVRDRSAFIIGVVAPLGLAVILNSVIPDFDGGEFEADYAVVDQDRGPASGPFREVIEQVPGVGVETDLSEDEVRAQVDDGDIDAAFVIPEGFSAAVADPDGTPPAIVVIGNVDAEIAVQVAQSIADRYAAGIDAVRLSAALAASGSGAALSPQLFEEAQGQQPPIELDNLPADDRQLDSTTYLTAGLGVLFLFFLVQFGVAGLLEERGAGTLPRLLAAPIHPVVIPAAKALTSVALGLIGMTVLVVVSTVAMGADWGDPLAAAVLIVAMVLAAVSFVALVVGVTKTMEQASNAVSVIAMVLGLLGGSFFPISQGEGFVAKLAVATPHYWFLRGLGDASVGGIGDAVGPLLVLLAMALGVGAAGAALLWRGAWR